jgi:integrase
MKAGESRADGALPVGYGRLVMTCKMRRGRLRRTWSFRVRRAEQTTKQILGDHPSVSLDDARMRASQLIELVRSGADVREVVMDLPMEPSAPQNAPAPAFDGASFGALLTSYVKALRQDGKASAGDVEALFARHVSMPWPDLIDVPAARIDSIQIRDILAVLVHAGIRRQTNVLRSYLHAAFTHGAHSDLDPRRLESEVGRFNLGGNPVTLVPRIVEFESVRDRVLTDDELRQVWIGLDAVRPELAMTLRCNILLAGQRFRQQFRATWDHYEASKRMLTLEDAKGRRKAPIQHRLPVSDRVADLIEKLRTFNGHGTFIFSTNSGRTPINTSTISAVFTEVRSAAGSSTALNQDLPQARDLRRTIETRLQALGVDRDLRAQLLSHGRTSGIQQRHYERHDFLPEKAAALALLEEHIVRIVGGAPAQIEGRASSRAKRVASNEGNSSLGSTGRRGHALRSRTSVARAAADLPVDDARNSRRTRRG